MTAMCSGTSIYRLLRIGWTFVTVGTSCNEYSTKKILLFHNLEKILIKKKITKQYNGKERLDDGASARTALPA